MIEQPSAPVAALLGRDRATPALIADDRVWTVGDLVDHSGRLAAGLAARGVGVGGRVAVHLHNRVEAALTYLACLRLGAIVLPLNTRLTTPELLDLVERTRPVAYVGEPELYARFAPVPTELVPDEARILAGEPSWAALVATVAEPVDVAPDPDAPAILLATSGTTGRSKIVVWSHRTLANLHLSAAGRGIVPGAVYPLFTPMMHGAGVYFLLNAFTEGAVPVLVRRFDAGTVLDAMQRHLATTVFGLPFMCDALVREQRLRPRQVALRTATVAGDVCPTEVETAFEDVFGVPLLSFWAATEDVGATITDRRVGPYLRVIEQADVLITNTDGEPVGEGEVGELVTSSPTTSPGYWSGEHDVTPLGPFRSGDLVRQVEPGVLRYMGRQKDLIVRGGSNVSPAEVEDALRADPAVADVGVAGLPDDRLGQRIGAVLVLRGSARSAKDVLASVRTRLADHKVPERIAVVDSIPRNALTKIDRVAVGEILSGPRGVSDW